jgi:hypothetical protein
MPCQTQPYVSYWIGFLTAVFAVIIAHCFALWRDYKIAKERRKLDFLGLLGGIRAEAERMPPLGYSKTFANRVYDLRRASPKVRYDLNSQRQVEFDEAVTAFCRLGDREVEEVGDNENYLGRNRVASAIDKITAIVERV